MLKQFFLCLFLLLTLPVLVTATNGAYGNNSSLVFDLSFNNAVNTSVYGAVFDNALNTSYLAGKYQNASFGDGGFYRVNISNDGKNFNNTLCFWANKSTGNNGPTTKYITGHKNDAATYFFSVDNNNGGSNAIRVYMRAGSCLNILTTTKMNDWQHYCIVWKYEDYINTYNLTWYVDGLLNQSVNGTAGNCAFNTTVPLNQIALYAHPNNAYRAVNSSLDEVMFFNRSLNRQEIKDIYDMRLTEYNVQAIKSYTPADFDSKEWEQKVYFNITINTTADSNPTVFWYINGTLNNTVSSTNLTYVNNIAQVGQNVNVTVGVTILGTNYTTKSWIFKVLPITQNTTTCSISVNDTSFIYAHNLNLTCSCTANQEWNITEMWVNAVKYNNTALLTGIIPGTFNLTCNKTNTTHYTRGETNTTINYAKAQFIYNMSFENTTGNWYGYVNTSVTLTGTYVYGPVGGQIDSYIDGVYFGSADNGTFDFIDNPVEKTTYITIVFPGDENFSYFNNTLSATWFTKPADRYDYLIPLMLFLLVILGFFGFICVKLGNNHGIAQAGLITTFFYLSLLGFRVLVSSALTMGVTVAIRNLFDVMEYVLMALVIVSALYVFIQVIIKLFALMINRKPKELYDDKVFQK